MKVTISGLKPKVINYRNYKKFDECSLLSNIKEEHFKCKSCDVNEDYENFVQKLLKIVNNRAPLKSKTVRRNNVSFMNKDWRKAFYERKSLKSIYNKKRSRNNWNNCKKQINLCTNLRRKSTKRHFRNVSEGKSFSSNINFGKIIKPFLRNRGFMEGNLLKREMKL